MGSEFTIGFETKNILKYIYAKLIKVQQIKMKTKKIKKKGTKLYESGYFNYYWQ